MKVIGVTGGVGAGKSMILGYIEDNYNCRVIYSDVVANDIKKKGQPCYEPIVRLLSEDILDESGEIDKKKMAARIFSDEALLSEVNKILHPAVNKYIMDCIDEERREAKLDFLFVEAALLIENGYKEVVDELWYIYASEDVRRQRLKSSRGYSDEKITDILKGQLSEKEFRKHADVVIDNSGSAEDAYRQIDAELGEA